MQRAELLTAVTPSNGKGEVGYQPAFDPDDLTVNTALNALTAVGNANFIVKADTRFAPILEGLAALRQRQQQAVDDIPLLDLSRE